MSKLVFLSFVSFAGVLFSACTRDMTVLQREDRSRTEPETELISFSAGFGSQTKAVETTAANLSSIYVSSFGDTAFEDVEFSKGTGRFYNSATPYYWPEAGNLSFFAYAPSKAELGGEWTVGQTVRQVRNFSPKVRISDQADFVVAFATGNRTDHGKSGVTLNFFHVLSQVRVLAKNTNPDISVRVAGMRIGSVGSMATLSASTTGFYSWSTSPSLEDYSITIRNPLTLSSSPVSVMGTEGSAMLIPQSLTAWDSDNDKTNTGRGAYLALYVNITKDGSVVCPRNGGADSFAWVAVPIGSIWEPGRNYVYILDIAGGGRYAPTEPDRPGEPTLVDDGEPIKFTVIVQEWQNGDNPLNGSVVVEDWEENALPVL